MESIDQTTQIHTILLFLNRIGIAIRPGVISDQSFLPGVEIVNGGIVYDEKLLTYPGDLLHEAGHIALVPSDKRTQLCGNATDQQLTDGGEEIGVMLWSYAAAIASGISPDLVFHSNGYLGQGQWLLDNYQSGNFIGLPLLQWMGLCHAYDRSPGFPKMIKWLRS